MTKLTLTNQMQNNTTLLENEFIDRYMATANGDFVKVYLLLLRHSNNPEISMNISKLADLLDCTENDVLRALNYWKKQGILDFEQNHLTFTSSAPSSKGAPEEAPVTTTPPSHTATKAGNDLKEILFVAEQYLGKTLTRTDIDTITFFQTDLAMSADLIEYLIEYCVENDHRSIHYIKQVALGWSEKQIKTVSEAKKDTQNYNRTYYSILKAYGITNRVAVPAEKKYIDHWTKELQLDLELILEACNRTMATIHEPKFSYTDKILQDWVKKGVSSLQDIKALDKNFLLGKQKKAQEASARPKVSANRFQNFEGRTYNNMDELTKQLIKTK